MFRIIAAVTGTLSALLSLIVMIVLSIQFDRKCGGHLERAAHANTVQLAAEELQVALDYMEKNELTTGYTSVLYRTPDEDLGFTYKNVKDGAIEMEKVKNSSTLEQTNALMKLRESLMTHGEKGMQLNVPDGISRYPANGLFGFWFLGSVLLAVGAFVAIVAMDD